MWVVCFELGGVDDQAAQAMSQNCRNQGDAALTDEQSTDKSFDARSPPNTPGLDRSVAARARLTAYASVPRLSFLKDQVVRATGGLGELGED